MALKILLIIAFFSLCIAFMVWINVRVLHPVALLLIEPSYSWGSKSESARKVSGLWEGGRVEFSVSYSNPATFAVALYRETSLPKIEVRSGYEGQLVFDLIGNGCIFRKVNGSFTEQDIESIGAVPQEGQVTVMRFFNPTRVQIARELISVYSMDVITIDGKGFGARTANNKATPS